MSELKPGIYDGMPMSEYLAIDALSCSPVRTLMDECPRAGWHASRLNPDREVEQSEIMDRGSIAHSIVLEQSTDCVVVIDPAKHPNEDGKGFAKGWTNKSIKAARDEARAAGKHPILKAKFELVEQMVIETARYIDSFMETEPALWKMMEHEGGKSEVVMLWREGDLLCKLRADRLANDYRVCLDYKTSGTSVEPDRWGRTQLTGMGYAFDAAWYRRGIRAAAGVDCDFVFLAQECEAPYLCSLIGIDPAWQALGAAKVQAGLSAWQECMRTGEWPGYPARVTYPELPAWESARFEAQLEERGHVVDYAKLTGRAPIEEMTK